MLPGRCGIAVVIVACAMASRAQAQEPVLLKYKPTKGDKLYYKAKQHMDQKQTLTIMGMAIKLENMVDQEAISSQTIDSIAADGNATIIVKGERRKAMAEFGGAGKFEFDSKSTERDTSSQLGSELTPLLERLTGSEYQLIITPRGAVTEVKGFAELVGDLVKDKQFASIFASADNKSAAYQEQDAFVILSEKPVKPGDSWEVPYDVELPMVGTIKGKNVYTYEGPDKVGDRPTARIGVVSELSIELKIDSPSSKVTGTLTSSGSTQSVQFDPVAGRVVSAKQKFSMAGQLTVEAGGMIIPIENQQDHTGSWELLDKLPE